VDPIISKAHSNTELLLYTLLYFSKKAIHISILNILQTFTLVGENLSNVQKDACQQSWLFRLYIYPRIYSPSSLYLSLVLSNLFFRWQGGSNQISYRVNKIFPFHSTFLEFSFYQNHPTEHLENCTNKSFVRYIACLGSREGHESKIITDVKCYT
jgi:hypothetical protein